MKSSFQLGVQYSTVESANKIKFPFSKYGAGVVSEYRSFKRGVCILHIKLLDLIAFSSTTYSVTLFAQRRVKVRNGLFQS